MPTFNLTSDLAVHYLDVNPDGTRTALLLHGLGVSCNSWRLQIPALAAAGYRVIAPDFRGFGRSSYPGRTSIADMARDVAELVRAVATGLVDVVGISMGGIVALRLVLEHADVVDRLVLVNSTARLRPQNPLGWVIYALRYAALYSLGTVGQARLVARHTFPHPHQEELRNFLYEQIIQSNPYAYRAALRALGQFDVSAGLGAIRAATLVVSGALDTAIPLSDQQPLAAGIPGACQVVIPDAGHGVIAECPEVFNRILLQFLGGVPIALPGL